MYRSLRLFVLALGLLANLNAALAVGPALTFVGQYQTGIYDAGACEISAFDPVTERLFVVSAAASSILVLDLSNPATPTLLFTIVGAPFGASFNSVAIHNGIVAAAVEAAPQTNPGKIVFFDTNGNYLNDVPAGALPDMVTFSPNGRYVLSANEGQPNDAYTIDPEGSVTIVDLAGGVLSPVVQTASFAAFNGQEAALRAQGIRIYGPGANSAMDFEPEYIAVDAASATAYVTLQENNAMAVIDIATATVTALHPFGYKNHNLAGNRLDPSDQAGDGIDIANWPVFGMYQPDGIAAYEVGGATYLVTANEGDARAYSGLNEEIRMRSGITLDPVLYPNAATLRDNLNLGRLRLTNQLGNTDSDAQFEAMYAYGARSFSIWDENGNQVFDSGDDFEVRLAGMLPAVFNSSNSGNQSFDSRSDDKGPEPEGVVVAEVCGRTFAFIGLERIGGVMIYDITDPANSYYVDYVTARDFSVVVNPADSASLAAVVELGPEGVLFVSANDSPNGQAMLVLSNEINGSVTVYTMECDEILPVEFGSFDAVSGDAEVTLNWNTLSENNNERFEVTRNGVIVANVASLGNSAHGHHYAWTDHAVSNGTTYSYTLSSVALDGTRETLGSASATPSAATGLPTDFALHAAYPNPFNPSTSISFSLPASSHVTLQIFDVNGRGIATLVDGALNAGTHSVTFDAANLASGIYFARINAGSFSASHKLVLMK
ncbi:MAG: T9SS type A sorting domain-containing protein [bacterium]|nr:T9SS type A sorting domain-containing protein [bacterium]MBK8127684.1 T9SS type A sorting domain-containing protein [bacterium]